MKRKPWTKYEDHFLAALYGKVESIEIAEALGRSLTSVYNRAKLLGKARTVHIFNERSYQIIREKHALGWSDAEIAAVLKCDRHHVGIHRRKIGLPSNAHSEHQRDRVRKKTREQLKRAGVNSLADIRAKAFRDYARRCGWPEDLPPRCVHILNALWQCGPMTRPEIAKAIGMPWKGSRASLSAANHPGGSYLALLMRRGMVIAFKRAVKRPNRLNAVGSYKGNFNLDLYSLPLNIHREVPHEQRKEWTRTPTAAEFRDAGVVDANARSRRRADDRGCDEGDDHSPGREGQEGR